MRMNDWAEMMTPRGSFPKKMIPWGKPHIGRKERAYVLRALKSTWISGGEYVDELEKSFARAIGSRFAVTMSSGTAALHLAMLAARIGPGDEVVVPGFTFAAPANMVLQVGAKPVFADIDPSTWCVDPLSVKRCMTSKTKAIVAVHVYGNVCDMEALKSIAKERDIVCIEDAAEAAFSKYQGKSAGSLGDLGCFSFQATKTITTGEGGAVSTNDEEISRRLRVLRSHGMRENKRYWHDAIGFNYRLTNLQAALGCAQMQDLDRILKDRVRIFLRYRRNLENETGMEFQRFSPSVDPIMWAVALKISPDRFGGDRDWLIAELLKRNVEARPGFYPFSLMPAYEASPLPVSEFISKNVILMPSYRGLSNRSIDRICDQVLALSRT
jgi:perosamine synthetase